jgi:integral membrane protein, TerC family
MPPIFAVLNEMPPLPLWTWLAFFGFIAAMLALDLGVFHRVAHEVKMKEALRWCAVWIGLALAFNVLLWWWRGPVLAKEFFAAYIVEKALSVDNVFVFILVFTYFRVPPRFQHRVLFWGVVGAVVMRTVFILVGVSVIARFHWVLYIFGAFLVFTGIKMALPGKSEVDVNPDHNFIVRLFRKFYPVAPHDDNGRFFTTHNGRRMATPLFVVLRRRKSTVANRIPSEASTRPKAFSPNCRSKTCLVHAQPWSQVVGPAGASVAASCASRATPPITRVSAAKVK